MLCLAASLFAVTNDTAIELCQMIIKFEDGSLICVDNNNDINNSNNLPLLELQTHLYGC